MQKTLGTGMADARQAAFKVAAIYALVAGTWILFSDRILLLFFKDPQQLTLLQTVKGWFYVFATAGFLAWLVQHYITAIRRKDERLREINLGMSVATGEALFNALAKNLATALDADCVVICELTGAGNENMRSLAAYARGKDIDNFECPWAGTPCEKILKERGECFYPSGVRQLYPQQPLLEELAVESFLGTRLIDSAGRTVGLMMVMDGKPLRNKELADEIFPLFTMRAAVELDRKRTGEALQESKRRLSTLMTNLPGMAYRCRNDRNWTMEFVSDGCRALTGYAPEDLIDNKNVAFADTFVPEDREKVWEQVQAALAEKEPFRIEYRIRTAGGEERWVWEQGRGVFDQNGELLALEGFITDITERKRAEEAQSRLASIVESSDDAIIGKTLDGVIVDWNPGAKEIYGYSAEEIVGQSISVLAPPEHQDRGRRIREKIRQGERIDHYDAVHVRKDGEPIHISLTVSPVKDAAGRLIGSSTVARDITWRKRMEESLRAQFEQITTIFDSLDAVVYAADLETSELLYLNRYGASVFREDWQGRTVCEILHTGAAGPCEFCPSSELVHEGEPLAACHWESHHAAAQRWYRCTDKAIRWSDGRLARLGIAIDITDLKQAE